MLIAPHTSMFQESPASDDLPAGLSLGIGPFVRALEIASGVDADIIGKPTRHFFEMAIGRIKRNHPEAGDFGYEDVGIVGDDVVNDLGEGAKELGLKRILGADGVPLKTELTSSSTDRKVQARGRGHNTSARSGLRLVCGICGRSHVAIEAARCPCFAN